MTASTLAPAFNSWRTTDPEDVLSKFPKARIARARRRTIQPRAGQPFNVFTVLGEGRFDDRYATYTITFDGRRYHCSCQDHNGGQYRNMCSHSLAVLLHRKANRIVGGGASTAEAVSPSVQPEVSDLGSGRSDIPAPDDAMWTQEPYNPPLPAWVTSFRPHQWDAVNEIVAAFEAGNRVVFGDAPTGAGKTLLAEMTRRLLRTRALYVCSTKSLQDQFIADFPYAKVLKGRGNYPTLDRAIDFANRDKWGQSTLSAADCTKTRMLLPGCASCPDTTGGEGLHCNWCHPWWDCPYEQAKTAALSSPLAVLNTSYYLTEANRVGKFSAIDNNSHGWDLTSFGLVIIDEADLLESELMGQVEVRITLSTRKKLSINPPDKKTVESSWVAWVNDECLPKITAAMRKLPSKSTDVKVHRERQRLERLLAKVRVLADGLGNGNWVYGGYADEEIVFRPIRVDGFGPEMLWRHSPRFLLMSATIISTDEMASSLGLAS